MRARSLGALVKARAVGMTQHSRGIVRWSFSPFPLRHPERSRFSGGGGIWRGGLRECFFLWKPVAVRARSLGALVKASRCRDDAAFSQNSLMVAWYFRCVIPSGAGFQAEGGIWRGASSFARFESGL